MPRSMVSSSGAVRSSKKFISKRRRVVLGICLVLLPTQGGCFHVLPSRCRFESQLRRHATKSRSRQLHSQAQELDGGDSGSVPGVLRDVVIEKIEELGGGKVQQVCLCICVTYKRGIHVVASCVKQGPERQLAVLPDLLCVRYFVPTQSLLLIVLSFSVALQKHHLPPTCDAHDQLQVQETTAGPGLHNRHFKYTATGGTFMAKIAKASRSSPPTNDWREASLDNFFAEQTGLEVRGTKLDGVHHSCTCGLTTQ